MKIQELLTDESKWTKGSPFRDKEGNRIFTPNNAASYCLLGAINKCYGYDSKENNTIYRKIRNYLVELGEISLSHSISHFNDNSETQFEDIRKLIEELDI